jgi:photosystem II stability/assembly factor-like uncharacterized protein
VIRKKIFGVLLTLLILFAISTIAFAQGSGLIENFDKPDLPAGWEHTPGVEVRDGVLYLPSESFVATPGVWGNMELNILLRRTGDGDFVISYGNNEGNAYHLLNSASRITLQHESAGALNEVAATDMEFIPAGEWFQVTIQVANNQHSIFINGNHLLNAEFPAQAFGGISFETFAETGIEIDSVEIAGERAGQPDDEAEPEAQPAPTQPNTGADSDLPSLPWVYTGGPSGGLGYDIRMDSQNNDIMYVTDAWAGAFKSTDGGGSWNPINNGIMARVGPSSDGIPVFSLTIDPNNSSRLWVGTQFGGGVFRSDNGGENWQSMSNGIQERSLTIRGFTVEPGDSDVVYLAGEVASWEWNGTPLDGIGFDLTKGAIYKTSDGGANWTRIWFGDNLARYVLIDPGDHNRLYASTGIFDREAANSNPAVLEMGGVGILRSSDSGATWEVLGAANGIREDELFFGSLSMHPENPDILIGAAGNDAYLFALNREIGAIYRTENGGDSWERVLNLPNASAVEICESDPNTVYAAAMTGFYRSNDGGKSWEQQGGTGDMSQTGAALWGPPDIVAGFPIDMQCDLQNPMRIFVNNYGGGNFLSEDGGKTWADASKGYTGAIMHEVTVAKGNPALIYASARSGVFFSNDGGENWQGMAYGAARAMEAFAIAANPEDANHIITVIGDAGPRPKISYDGGQSWQEAELEMGEHGFHEWGAIKKMAFSPTQSNRVVGIQADFDCEDESRNCNEEGHGVIFSDDGGQSWQRANLQQGMGTELIFARDGTAYLSIYPSDIYRSTDGGETWMLVTQNITASVQRHDPDSSGAILRALAIDPQNPNKLYAGITGGGIMLSEDGGINWQLSAAGMLPETSVFDLAADAAHPDVVYATSNDAGVYRTTDGGESWAAINDGLLTRAGVSLSLSDDGTVLYLATTGGGVFRLGTPALTSQSSQTGIEPATAPDSSTENGQSPNIPCLGGLAPVGLIGVGWVWRRREKR